MHFAVRILNRSPHVLAGALPGDERRMRIAPGETVERDDVSAATVQRLIENGAVALRRGNALVFEVAVSSSGVQAAKSV